MALALVDFVPVFFFGLIAIRIGIILNCYTVLAGAVAVFLSGLIKVAWKIIVVLKKKNIWWMFIQMRIVMPIGFLIMIFGAIFMAPSGSLPALGSMILEMPNVIFTVLGILGMGCMIAFSLLLDSTDKKSNWIEQSINGIAQICFFIAVIL